MNNFKFGTRSLEILDTVEPELQECVHRALYHSRVDFSVIEGLRDMDTQRRYVAEGKSQTLRSYHLIGCAVDLYPWVDGYTSHYYEHYNQIARAMFRASQETGLILEWGGFWLSFRDMPHWQATELKLLPKFA